VSLLIAIDDPQADDVRALLATHLAFAHEVTPTRGVHALDSEALLDPSITFFSARIEGELRGIGALKQLDDAHAELKSMHTAESAREQGVGRAMVEHLLSVALDRRCRRVSLETGTMDAFAPARRLYEQLGFEPCEPFREYRGSTTSACMTIVLDPDAG
jgi:putative acetyltransferase